VSNESSEIKIIDTAEELLAHALTLETEAAERYEEIADNMDVHNNPEVAGLFRQLAKYGRMHAAEVEELSKDMELPHISPWDFKWGTESGESPEAPPIEKIHYMMNPYQALKVAHFVETQAQEFYASVAETSPDKRTQEIAKEFSEEEQEHVDLLNEWLKKYPKPEKDWDYDPDPPMMHE